MPIVETKNSVTPPPARKPRQAAAPKAPSVTTADIRKKREDGANEFWGMLSMVSIGCGWWADAATYQVQGPKVSKHVVRMADENEKIAAALDKFAEVAPVAELLSSVVMIGVQIAVNHKLISRQRGAIFGAMDPDALEIQMKAQFERQMLEERIQAQREADELAAMRDEMDGRDMMTDSRYVVTETP